jgi:hypothetical protein
MLDVSYTESPTDGSQAQTVVHLQLSAPLMKSLRGRTSLRDTMASPFTFSRRHDMLVGQPAKPDGFDGLWTDRSRDEGAEKK